MAGGFATRHQEKIIIGICDDNETLMNLNVYGFFVIGKTTDLEKICKKTPFNEILVTVSDLEPEKKKVLKNFAKEHNIKLTQFVCKETVF